MLAVIVIAQFAGTSLWFSGNALVPLLVEPDQWVEFSARSTQSVQFGFILGTFLFAVLNIADRFSAKWVFVACCILGALFNLGVLTETPLLFRFLTGLALAGIYPVGMKLAARLAPDQIGNALGFLVGALVLGSALPYILGHYLLAFSVESVVFCISSVAGFGGLLVAVALPNTGSTTITRFHWGTLPSLFQDRRFRSASFGYFGHMWELYAFWSFLPVFLRNWHIESSSIYIFWVMAAGALGCVLGGLLSRKLGSYRVAFTALATSGLLCLASPLFGHLSFTIGFALLLVWGFAVVADSPQFSSLNTQFAPKELTGTALTIVNSIGFGLTIVSIEALRIWLDWASQAQQFMYWLLAIGPLLGLLSMYGLRKDKST